jgi:hypothetical protein
MENSWFHAPDRLRLRGATITYARVARGETVAIDHDRFHLRRRRGNDRSRSHRCHGRRLGAGIATCAEVELGATSFEGKGALLVFDRLFLRLLRHGQHITVDRRCDGRRLQGSRRRGFFHFKIVLVSTVLIKKTRSREEKKDHERDGRTCPCHFFSASLALCGA